MNQNRTIISDLLGAFDELLQGLALRHNLTFHPTCGPTLGRALRRNEDKIQLGVFLELNDRWYEADPTNPNVTIAYCAWLHPTGKDFPRYFFSRRLFVGKWLDVKPEAGRLLAEAAESVVKLTQEEIRSKGQYFERLEDALKD